MSTMSTIAQLREAVRTAQAALDSYEIDGDTVAMGYMYDAMLDDVYGDIEICGMTYSASCALYSVDKVAYQCGKNDWVDSLDKEDQPDYKELVEELEEAEAELADAEEQAESEASDAE